MAFLYTLNQSVEINVSGEAGHIKARSESINHCNQYLLHYQAADGQVREAWFDEDEVGPVEEL